MKRTMITLLVGFISLHSLAQTDTLLTVFWNLENFYDYHSDNKALTWTGARFYAKCDAVAKIIFRISEDYGRFPDVVAFSEIENAFVIRSLLSTSLLSKLNYSIVHYESSDHRNMDCALIYRQGSLKLKSSTAKHIYDESGEILQTRDILLAEFDSLAVLVNHHPSQIGGKTRARELARQRMQSLADSLLTAWHRGVLAIGDFNEDLWGLDTQGSIKYNGVWEKIDGHFIYGQLQSQEKVWYDELLLTRDKSYGGLKPRRCFSGPAYLGGISDHLPIVVLLTF